MKQREIKFRAWFSGIPAMVYFGLGENNIDVYDSIDDKFTVDINDADLIMQYTGLKDVNGKEIYEGDIVVEEIQTGKYQPFEVKWHYTFAGFDMCAAPNWTILGNIYENPELLQK